LQLQNLSYFPYPSSFHFPDLVDVVVVRALSNHEHDDLGLDDSELPKEARLSITSDKTYLSNAPSYHQGPNCNSELAPDTNKQILTLHSWRA